MELPACKNRDKTGLSMEGSNDEYGDGSSGAVKENGRMLFPGSKKLACQQQINSLQLKMAVLLTLHRKRGAMKARGLKPCFGEIPARICIIPGNLFSYHG